MNEEFDKTKVYTPLNITKDLIGAKGYYDDNIEGLRDSLNNENFGLGEVVNFNDNVIFIKNNNINVLWGNPHGWQFFYLVEMPKEKQEKWWIVPTCSPFADSNLFDTFGYCYKVKPQEDSYSRSYPPLKSDFNSKEEAEKWLKGYLETSDELEINGVLDFSKSNYTFKDFQEEFIRICEELDVSFGGGFFELDRNGKRK